MAIRHLIGKIVSQPVVITGDDMALVMLKIKSDDGYTEMHYQCPVGSFRNGLAGRFANSQFSAIALSAVGDVVEVEIRGNGEVYSFHNKTQEER